MTKLNGKIHQSLVEAAELVLNDPAGLTSPTDTAPGDSDTITQVGLASIKGNSVLLEATFRDLTADEVKSALDEAGIEWRATDSNEGLTITEILTNAGTIRTFVAGYFPADVITSLPNVVGVSDDGKDSFISAMPIAFGSSVGAVTSQGDDVQQSDEARLNLGVDGSGITVGVLSDSYGAELGADGTTPTSTTVADDVASGDLPAGAIILEEGSALSTDGDEGRAMAQLIFDVAPGANIAFHTANGGQGNFASGITQLRNDANADVIVDDIIYFAEPIFQDGVVAQAAANVIADGASFLSSAGNNGDDAFFDSFRDSGVDASEVAVLSGAALGVAGALHDWNAGDGVSTFVELTLADGESFDLSFQWDDPYASAGGAGATSDFDIFVTRVSEVDGTVSEEVVDTGFFNNLNSDPIEIVGHVNESGGTETIRLYISEFNPSESSDNTVLAGVFFGSAGGQLTELFNPVVDDGLGGRIAATQFDAPTSFGHTIADGAIGVGASAYFNTANGNENLSLSRLNSFSAKGGYAILYDEFGVRLETPDIRDGVDVVGPDGGNTTFFGGDADGDGLPNFFGTSASAPHVAGVVALMLDANPDLTPAEIEQILEDSAAGDVIQLDSLGRAVDSSYVGAGFIDAEVAVQAALDLRPDNSAPTIEDDAFAVLENSDGVLSGNVFAANGGNADTDDKDATLTVSAVNGLAENVGVAITLSGGGLATIDSDGTITIDPNGAYESLAELTTAAESLTYTVTDSGGLSDDGTVTITFTGENDAPIAADDAITISEDVTGVIGNVFNDNSLGADSDVDDGAVLSVTGVGGAAVVGQDVALAGGGVVQISDLGEITFDGLSAYDFLADDDELVEDIVYEITDDFGATSSATLSISLIGANDDPETIEDSVLVEAAGSDRIISVLDNDSDPDQNDTLTILSIDTTGTVGLATDNGDGTVTYNPNGQFAALTGTDFATDTFTYTVQDSLGATATETVTVIVVAENAAPIAEDDVASTDEDTSVALIDAFNNDTDGNAAAGDTLRFVSLDATLTIGAVLYNGDGTFSYDPNGAFDTLTGTDQTTDSFAYTVEDGFGAQSTATVTITIDGVNDAPLIVDDTGVTTENASILLSDPLTNDSDVDSPGGLTLIGIDTSALLGAATLNLDGTIAYDPGDAFKGLRDGEEATDTLTYIAEDVDGAQAQGTITITVGGIDNLAAIDDVGDLTDGAISSTVSVLSNDFSPADGGPFITGFTSSGTFGRVTGFNSNGEFTYTLPDYFAFLVPGVSITEEFTYFVQDSDGAQDTATVSIEFESSAVATDFDDTLIGNSDDNLIEGLDGSDLIVGYMTDLTAIDELLISLGLEPTTVTTDAAQSQAVVGGGITNGSTLFVDPIDQVDTVEAVDYVGGVTTVDAGSSSVPYKGWLADEWQGYEELISEVMSGYWEHLA